MYLHDPSKAAQDVQMTQTMSQRPSRRATYLALVVFGLAYIGVMVIIFAPEGSLSSRNPLMSAEQAK
jgi:hypothetical protein